MMAEYAASAEPAARRCTTTRTDPAGLAVRAEAAGESVGSNHHETSVRWQVPAVEEQVPVLRHAARRLLLARRRWHHRASDAETVISELTTNAVCHGSGTPTAVMDVCLTIRCDDTLLVRVMNEPRAGAAASSEDANELPEHGWGLAAVVAEYADVWDIDETGLWVVATATLSPEVTP